MVRRSPVDRHTPAVVADIPWMHVLTARNSYYSTGNDCVGRSGQDKDEHSCHTRTRKGCTPSNLYTCLAPFAEINTCRAAGECIPFSLLKNTHAPSLSPMSSRRRRHSGPPPQHFRGASYPDEHDWHPSSHRPRANSVYDGLPPPHYEPSYPRSETRPVNRPEVDRDRGRGRERGHHTGFREGYEARSPQPAYGESRSQRPRRPRSHDRMSDRDSTRGRGSPSRHARMPQGSGTRRSKSTSSPAPRHQTWQATASQWWQNPIVRTCAITAVSTGLSAALDSRGDPGQWKGAKGAKVAVASLGSALVDGFLGHKHPNSVRQQVARKGFQVAMEETEKKKQQPTDARKDGAQRPKDGHRRRRRGGRSRSRGRHDEGNNGQ